jgi:hypothetical protein
VGINVKTRELYAPDGLQEMWEGILRINLLNPQQELFQQKAESLRSRWPWLTIISAGFTDSYFQQP